MDIFQSSIEARYWKCQFPGDFHSSSHSICHSLGIGESRSYSPGSLGNFGGGGGVFFQLKLTIISSKHYTLEVLNFIKSR